MSARRRNTTRVVLGAAFLGLAAGGVAACDSSDDDHVFYCVDEFDVIVDDELCEEESVAGGAVDDDDDDGRHYFWAHSTRYKRGLKPGAKLPSGGAKFAYNDRTQRAAWGLPSSGKISNGTVKSSVVGSGDSSSHRSSGG